LKQTSNPTLVVGAGIGGIVSALLASLRGEKVTLVEAHSHLGGCASYFKRGKFTFDVGATTLSGISEDGPVKTLFSLLGDSPEVYVADPGIVFHLTSGKVVRYHRDFEAWIHELNHHFPGKNHRSFWKKINSLNLEGWKLFKTLGIFPPQSFNDYVGALSNWKALKLLPGLLISTEMFLKWYALDDPDYLELINGILLISAQASAEQVPLLVGAMALSYPGETYAVKGGMKGLMDFFEHHLKEKGVEVLKKSEVLSIGEGKIRLNDDRVFHANKIISNLTIWNMPLLTEGFRQHSFSKEALSYPEAWGAFTLYFAVETHIFQLYHQVFLHNELVENYFVSFSHPEDHSRAPQGYQTVTISTHVRVHQNLDRNQYQQIIMDDFKTRFKCSEIHHLHSGTPQTFERFTGRYLGFVGGIPFRYGKNPFKIPGPLTQDATLFRVGDTTFPGQGICGVTAGALLLHRYFVQKSDRNRG
jgi:C-3',4' desaturase CrtD